MTHPLRHCLILALSLAVDNAWACSTQSLHRQWAVLAEFGGQAPQLPQDISLHVGDLISVLAPLSSTVRTADAQHRSTPVLTALDPARYQALSHYQGGKAPVEIQAGVYPAHLGWLHFGANQAGVAYLQLTAGAEHALLRVDTRLPCGQHLSLHHPTPRPSGMLTR